MRSKKGKGQVVNWSLIRYWTEVERQRPPSGVNCNTINLTIHFLPMTPHLDKHNTGNLFTRLS